MSKISWTIKGPWCKNKRKSGFALGVEFLSYNDVRGCWRFGLALGFWLIDFKGKKKNQEDI